MLILKIKINIAHESFCRLILNIVRKLWAIQQLKSREAIIELLL